MSPVEMSPVEMLEASCKLAARQVAAAADHADQATPCEGWNVEMLVGHMVAALEGNTAILGGPNSGANPFDPQPIAGADMVSRFEKASADTVAAAAALEMDAMMSHPASEDPMPVAAALMFPTFDQYVHSWDLAQVTGLAGDYPEPLHGAIAAWCQQAFAGDRQPGIVGPAVDAPHGATPMQQLAAFLGRSS